MPLSVCHPLVRLRGWIIPRSRSADAAPARGVEGHSLGRDPSAGSEATEDGGEAKACNEHAGRLTVAARSLLEGNLCADQAHAASGAKPRRGKLVRPTRPNAFYCERSSLSRHKDESNQYSNIAKLSTGSLAREECLICVYNSVTGFFRRASH